MLTSGRTVCAGKLEVFTDVIRAPVLMTGATCAGDWSRQLQ
jgi:hypothetical protein